MDNLKKTETKELGATAENLAANYLKSKGYLILERNYKTKIGEIDIIAKKGKDLIFIEVKSRFGSDERYSPFDNITAKKKRKLIRLAKFYIKAERISYNSPVQIDVIAVEFNCDQRPLITHIEKAIF